MEGLILKPADFLEQWHYIFIIRHTVSWKSSRKQFVKNRFCLADEWNWVSSYFHACIFGAARVIVFTNLTPLVSPSKLHFLLISSQPPITHLCPLHINQPDSFFLKKNVMQNKIWKNNIARGNRKKDARIFSAVLCCDAVCMYVCVVLHQPGVGR